MKRKLLIIIGVISFSWACSTSEGPVLESELVIEPEDIETPDWTDETHSKSTDPDYGVVFEEEKVHRLDIRIEADDWAAMQSDLASNMSGSQGPGIVEIDFTPIWAPSTVSFQGMDWYKVGIRYKGNSTLRNAYQQGTDKYPFKLDFDEFEDYFPAIENQRFYGFKQLNLSNNDSDNSCIREKVAADLFREFGVPSARTAFYEVYLDKGNGSELIGIYTLVEEVDDTLAESQFEDKDGNLYKPDGTGATFAAGTYAEADMDKKSNEDEADYSDVKGLYDLLQSADRTQNPTQWQADLESMFDVDGFLKYLAVNNTIENWDTYGNMTHNYFLYNHQGKLTWIPWDNNEALQDGKMGGSLSLSMSEVSDNWPIIRYIMDVSTYQSQYESYLNEFISQVFAPATMKQRYAEYELLLSSYASQEGVNMSSGINELESHVDDRAVIVNNYLGQ